MRQAQGLADAAYLLVILRVFVGLRALLERVAQHTRRVSATGIRAHGADFDVAHVMDNLRISAMASLNITRAHPQPPLVARVRHRCLRRALLHDPTSDA